MAKKNLLVDLDLNLNQLLNIKLQNLAVPPTTTSWNGINLGFTYFNTTDKKVYVWDGTTWTIPNVPANLGYTASGTNGVITNSNGTNATLPLGDTTNAGLLPPADKVKINTAILTSTTDVSAASFVLTDTTLAANSTTKVPTQNAVKTYVDSLILSYGALVFQGGYNASTNTPLLDATPVAGIKKGWTYVVTVAGIFFSENVEAGDMIIAEIDSPILLTDWVIVNKNIPDVISTLLTGYVTGTNTGLGSGDSILVAFGKIQAQLNNKIAINGNGSSLTGMTKSQVGLSNVDNTSDANKPVSTAQQTALNLKAPISSPVFSWSASIDATTISPQTAFTITTDGIVTTTIEKNGNIKATKFELYGGTANQFLMANGSTLTANFLTQNNHVPQAIPRFGTANGTLEASQMYETGGNIVIGTGSTYGAKFEITTGNGSMKSDGFIKNGGTSSQFLKADGSVDSSVYLTGVTKLSVGLGNVDNTSDVNKPVSTAQQTALNLKANLLSPALSGTPTAPTAPVNTNTTQIATTAFVLAQGYSTTTGTVRKTSPTLIGNGVATSYVVTHGFGPDAIAQARYASDNSVVDCEMLINSGGTVTFNFNLPVPSNSIKVVIVG